MTTNQFIQMKSSDLIMVVKIIFTIKIMENNSMIEFMQIININDNSHNNTN